MVGTRNFKIIIGAIASISFAAAIAFSRTGPPSKGISIRPSEPYVGEWSNGRGDTLVIKAKTIKFGSDRAVDYRDVTKVTNGKEFHLEVTSEGKLNYITKFLHVSMGDGDKPEEMKMTLYNSLKDMQDGENAQGEATWYRDK